MQTITLQINDDSALKTIKELEREHTVRIIDGFDIDSPALPGKPMSIDAFRNWISEAEAAPTISLEEFKTRWAIRRKQLQSLTR